MGEPRRKLGGLWIGGCWGTSMGAGNALDGKEQGGPLIRRSWEDFGRSSEGVGGSWEGL